MQANKQATIEATSLHILPGSSNFPARATSNSTGEILRTKSAIYLLEETSERFPRPQVKHDDLSVFLLVSYGRIEAIGSPHFLQANKFCRH